jgi:hypothetical protein
MSPAPKQAAKPSDDIEQALTRIRELNEQVLAQGRELGLGFLDAYEQTLKWFADAQTKAADAAGVDWVADVARAQTEFLRKVTDSYTATAREILKK